jgi:hypothetical protein
MEPDLDGAQTIWLQNWVLLTTCSFIELVVSFVPKDFQFATLIILICFNQFCFQGFFWIYASV